MEDNKTLELEIPARKGPIAVANHPDSVNLRRLEIEAMIMKGFTYRQIEARLHCSSRMISQVSKQIIQRNEANAESVQQILKTRLLSTASKALQKLDTGLEDEDDLKVIQSVFNSTYDRATGTKDGSGQQTVTIQLANMFSLPTASQDSKE